MVYDHFMCMVLHECASSEFLMEIYTRGEPARICIIHCICTCANAKVTGFTYHVMCGLYSMQYTCALYLKYYHDLQEKHFPAHVLHMTEAHFRKLMESVSY